jgi:PBP1b-binding outer membrane lipoprotein LpoB
MMRCLLLLLASTLFLVGCTPKPPPVVQNPPADEARTTLQRAADDGTVDSDVLALKGYFEDLKKTDPAKADPLLQDLEVMIQAGTQPSSGGSAQVKQKAQEMLQKL